MSEQKQDNLLIDDSERTESNDVVPENSEMAENFFSQLDRQVMGDTLSQPNEAAQLQQTTSPGENPTQEQPVVSDDTTNLEKRYSDSSREAKRLNTRLREIEPYMPVLDAMKEDPNLISHVRSYFEGGGSAPKNIKEQLGLDEDFVFDYDDALSSPDSSSAKLFNATVDGVVQKRLGEFARSQSDKSRKVSEENSFKSKFDIKDDDYNDLMDYAKSHRLTLEDVYYLKNRITRDDKVAGSARDEVIQQMKNVRSMPTSIASSGNLPQEDKSVDDVVFDKLLNTGSGLAELM